MSLSSKHVGDVIRDVFTFTASDSRTVRVWGGDARQEIFAFAPGEVTRLEIKALGRVHGGVHSPPWP